MSVDERWLWSQGRQGYKKQNKGTGMKSITETKNRVEV